MLLLHSWTFKHRDGTDSQSGGQRKNCTVVSVSVMLAGFLSPRGFGLNGSH